MKHLGIKLSLFLNYFVFAILLNSVGIVILKSINNYNVAESAASVLEAFKDLPIAIVSFAVASFLPRIGYKKAMLAGLAMVTVGCVLMYFGNSFDTAKLLFAIVGAAFALIKVSVYSVIGLVTDDTKGHNSLMSSIEGVFMIGIALAYFLFPAFNTEGEPDAWLNVYWLLAILSAISFVILLFTKFENTEQIIGTDAGEDFAAMFKLLLKMLTIVFVISAFLFVMIEQGIMSWLPTFNNKVLGLSENIGIMMASILALSLAAGRLLAGVLTQRISWIYVLLGCTIIAMLSVVFILPKTVGINVEEVTKFSDIPLIAFAFPLVGLFIAPIYPLLNSVVLSALPKRLHSQMTGLIVIFSALGGTFGSRIIGHLFETQGPENAFYFTLIPMTMLLVFYFILKRLTEKNAVQG
ncbi:MFS transporter [uncultured Dokdonia sp.]|uniref:MFS transporter n=1 Tax=uncultured Dokdonia sp. TaxID=575653 RepID=UPI00261283F1|nr:MFS transporter [uncultured Dokdonia sp.]